MIFVKYMCERFTCRNDFHSIDLLLNTVEIVAYRDSIEKSMYMSGAFAV